MARVKISGKRRAQRGSRLPLIDNGDRAARNGLSDRSKGLAVVQRFRRRTDDQPFEMPFRFGAELNDVDQPDFEQFFNRVEIAPAFLSSLLQFSQEHVGNRDPRYGNASMIRSACPVASRSIAALVSKMMDWL